jgi:hypothetical protein
MHLPPYDDNLLGRGDERGVDSHQPGPGWSLLHGPEQTNLFFKNIELSYLYQQGRLGAGPLAGFKIRQEVRRPRFGPAPQDCRLTSGAVAPETPAG